MESKIEKSWKTALADEFDKDYFIRLKSFLQNEYVSGQTIYPDQCNIFNAFNLCPLDDVRVVIIGQDPYHGPGQAHGLCFSVSGDVRTPPSLRNIYKEIENDLGHSSTTNGDLTSWAKQGVLMINNVLTVRKDQAASHKGQGWEQFTDAVMCTLSKRKNIVYILWGAPAKKKAGIINSEENLILESAHPSPLSAYRGFFGNNHFSKANEYLTKASKQDILW